ncbi:hypothetical protein GQ600_14773 [Phytophthora cactorum]|nr:hypothetical protein GQ600_14773 [Phytophthora cactorum]
MAGAREKRRAKRVAQGGTYMWRSVWSELKAGGWAYKLPPASSLETRWKFVPPGGNPNGIEGKDYFLGEEHVLVHYVSSAGEGGAAAVDGASEEEDDEDKYHLVPRGKRASSLAASNDGHSLFESSDEDEIAADGESKCTEEIASDAESEVSSLMSSDTDNDLNHVDDDDNPADFGGLDSGDEPEQDDIVDEDMPDETDE